MFDFLNAFIMTNDQAGSILRHDPSDKRLERHENVKDRAQ